MTKKKKIASKKSTKKSQKKVKFNKGTPYEVEWVYVEPVKTIKDKVNSVVLWIKTKIFGL